MPETNADCHPKKIHSVRKRSRKESFFAGSRSAYLALSVGDAGHNYVDAKMGIELIVVGRGTPCKLTNFSGVQQALVSFALSACMAFSSLSQ